jgi:hypothetical protein
LDVFQAIEKTTPFSDEGDVVIAITTNPGARAALLLGVFAVFLSLTLVVARRYRFEKHRAAKSVGATASMLVNQSKPIGLNRA